MQRDYYMTLEKFEKMFQRQPDGLACCKLCNKEILLLDTDEAEFWRHQVDREHLDSLINFYLTQDKDINVNKKGQIQIYEKNQPSSIEKKVNQFEKLMQKEAKRMIKTQQGSDQMKQIVDQLDRLMLKKQTNDEIIKKVKLNFPNIYSNDDNNLENGLYLTQNYKKQKKLDPQEIFSKSVEEYFNKFIVELIKKQQLTEVICFLLARIGISLKQICDINFTRIYQEINELNEICKDLPQIILTLNILKEMSSKLEQDVGEENQGFLIKQPKKPKALRKKLEGLRKTIRNETAFQDYKRFLEKLKVKSLNALFNSEIKNKMPQIKRRFSQDPIRKEQDEFYIDISNEDEDDGSLEADDQSAIFEGIESNPYKEQEQAQKQKLNENLQIKPFITNSRKPAYLEKVIEIIMEYECKRINQKQQKKNYEWNDQESSDDDNESSEQ
ncbi:unnamed protein product [Paramecium sonneborni]|uniref:Uncharacterized protein n=1 Tax=Paramecium sonneborni TaxID=65129 RepID=A0A8S1MTC1_9CILI|nr:unnamed protein product [Paramecium sonneborni]